MEILIIGIIIVALMVYTSTKIKKAAKEAYEPETVRTEEFSITKPQGYMIPAEDERSPYKLEIFSKAYGSGDCEKKRQAELNLIIENGSELASSRKAERAALNKVLDDDLIKDTQKITLTMIGEANDGDCSLRIFIKYFARNGKLYKFKATAIEEDIDDHLENIESMIESIIIF